jgi:flagellar assembly protein FliH
MAISSDWLAILAEPRQAAEPRWFAACGGGPAAFRDGATFAAPDMASARPCEAAAAREDETALPDPDEAALARAFAEGEAAGRAAAAAEHASEVGHLRALRLQFRALDEAALGVLTEELAATVQALCAQVLADYALDSDALAARCAAAAARLGSGWSGAALRLHPDDAAALRDGALAGWQIAPDPALERGALVIEGPDGAVRDTPADWRRALAEALRP